MLGMLHYMCDVSSILWVLLGTRTATVRLPPPGAPVDVLIYILISSRHQMMLRSSKTLAKLDFALSIIPPLFLSGLHTDK